MCGRPVCECVGPVPCPRAAVCVALLGSLWQLSLGPSRMIGRTGARRLRREGVSPAAWELEESGLRCPFNNPALHEHAWGGNRRGPHTWAPATHMGDRDGVLSSWLLLGPGCCGHSAGKAAQGIFSLCLPISSSFSSLCLSTKMNLKQEKAVKNLTPSFPQRLICNHFMCGRH